MQQGRVTFVSALGRKYKAFVMENCSKSSANGYLTNCMLKNNGITAARKIAPTMSLLGELF